METQSPAAVVKRASAIAPARAAGSPMEAPELRTPNAFMLPVTVPKSPSNVEIFAIVPSGVKKCSS